MSNLIQFCIPKNNEIETLVIKLMNDKNNNKDTNKLEAEINKCVYELYGLTEEEIAIVEGK